MAAYAARTGRDPARGIVAGDAAAILQRIAEYVEAGVTKFVLRPVGRGDDVPLAQTRLLLEQVLPLVAARWPKLAAG